MSEQVGAEDVAGEVKAWLVQHVNYFTEQAGLKPIAVWENLPSESSFLNRKLKFPALAVSTDGLATPATKNGRRGWDATWRIVVSVWVSTAREQEQTVTQTRQYAKAVRTCLMSKFDSRWWWVNERYSGIDDQRLDGLIGLATVELNVDVTQAVNSDGLTPGATEPAPVLTNIIVNVELKE